MVNIRLLLPVSLLILSLVPALSAQRPTRSSPADGYILEISRSKQIPVSYIPPYGWAWFPRFDRVPGWRLGEGELAVSAVKFYPRANEGSIRLKVSVLRGKSHEVEDLVGEYTVGTSKFVIDDLSRFGVVPFSVRVVERPSAAVTVPPVVNQTQSLDVSLERGRSTYPSLIARFVNKSGKPVAGLSYSLAQDKQNFTTGVPFREHGEMLFAPGADYECEIKLPLVSNADTKGSRPVYVDYLDLNIEAVFFTDGTYEGDRVEAARFKAMLLGEKLETARILELLRSVAVGNGDAAATIANGVPSDVTTSDLSTVLTEFPDLNDREVENLRIGANVSASRVLQSFRSDFKTRMNLDSAQLNEAVASAIKDYEKWLNNLP